MAKDKTLVAFRLPQDLIDRLDKAVEQLKQDPKNVMFTVTRTSVAHGAIADWLDRRDAAQKKKP